MGHLQYSAIPDGALVVTFSLDKTLAAQTYRITQVDKTIDVRGGDARGLMYAGLTLADNLDAGKELLKIGTVEGKPYMPYRGIKPS